MLSKTAMPIIRRSQQNHCPIPYSVAEKLWSSKKSSMSIQQSLYETIQEEVTKDTVCFEFGTGLSTFAMVHGKHYESFEQDLAQSRQFPNCKWSILGKDGWYRDTPSMLRSADVVLVDGPYGGDRKNGLDHILHVAARGATIFIDDIHRPDERELMFMLEKVCDDRQLIQVDRWAVLKEKRKELVIDPL